MTDSPILVTGATGQQGGATARALLARGRPVRALTRDPRAPGARELLDRGAEVVAGDLDDPASLRAAMDGVGGVFSVQTFLGPAGIGGEVRHGRAVAQAARHVGVEHVVHSSVGGAERRSGVPHFESKHAVERRLHELGVPTTILRPTFFMDNFAAHGPVREDGVLVVRLALRPSTPVQLIAVDDIGELAARAFAEPAAWIGRTVEIAGDELSADGIAAAFATATGEPARFDRLPLEAVAANPHIPFSHEIALMFEWLTEHGYAADVPALRREHPGLRTFASWLAERAWRPVTA